MTNEGIFSGARLSSSDAEAEAHATPARIQERSILAVKMVGRRLQNRGRKEHGDVAYFQTLPIYTTDK
jgi:hypothetical protein